MSEVDISSQRFERFLSLLGSDRLAYFVELADAEPRLADEFAEFIYVAHRCVLAARLVSSLAAKHNLDQVEVCLKGGLLCVFVGDYPDVFALRIDQTDLRVRNLLV